MQDSLAFVRFFYKNKHPVLLFNKRTNCITSGKCINKEECVKHKLFYILHGEVLRKATIIVSNN